MTIHPLLRLVATQPQLLADHAEAYAGLVGEELGKSAAQWKRRALLNAMAFGLAAAALVLAGVALMLWATLPAAQMQAPWVLIATPAATGLIAFVCGLAGRDRNADSFADLRQQLTADLALLREMGTA